MAPSDPKRTGLPEPTRDSAADRSQDLLPCGGRQTRCVVIRRHDERGPVWRPKDGDVVRLSWACSRPVTGAPSLGHTCPNSVQPWCGSRHPRFELVAGALTKCAAEEKSSGREGHRAGRRCVQRTIGTIGGEFIPVLTGVAVSQGSAKFRQASWPPDVAKEKVGCRAVADHDSGLAERFDRHRAARDVCAGHRVGLN